MLFHFLSHICACTHTHCYTFMCTNRHTHTHAHVAHTHVHAHTCTSGWPDWSPGGYEVILDMQVHVHCKNTYRPYRVNQTSVGCLKNVLIMTVTMIKSLIIIVDKIIKMVPLDYTTNSYSVEVTISYILKTT